MSLRGILIPHDGEPLVLKDKHWSVASITAVLGSPHHNGARARWSPSEKYWLLMLAASDAAARTIHPAAWSMLGPMAETMRGTLLVLAMNREHEVVSIPREDILTVALRLLVAEAATGALEA